MRWVLPALYVPRKARGNSSKACLTRRKNTPHHVERLILAVRVLLDGFVAAHLGQLGIKDLLQFLPDMAQPEDEDMLHAQNEGQVAEKIEQLCVVGVCGAPCYLNVAVASERRNEGVSNIAEIRPTQVSSAGWWA
jgi:hypothetical protein